MPKLTIADLKEIKKKAKKTIALREGEATIIITVHMGNCGIDAGAREVMHALLEEIAQADRHDIHVMNSGCMGECSNEPYVTVAVKGEEPVIYQHMDKNRIQQVFKHHILLGEVQTDFTREKIKASD